MGALGASAAGAASCAVQLAAEGTRLGGQRGRAELALGVVCIGLGLLAAAAAVRWALLRRPVLLPQRLGIGSYLGVLALAFALALTAGHLWSGQGRPALAAFAGLSCAQLLVLGLGLVPSWAADARGTLDLLGRRTPLSSFSAYSLQRTQADPPRFALRLSGNPPVEALALRLADVDTAALAALLDSVPLVRRSG